MLFFAQIRTVKTYPSARPLTKLSLGVWQLLGRGGGVGHD